MRIIFFGSGRFGIPSLEALLKSSHKLLCVVTQPPARGGRGLKFISTPIKIWAEENKISTLQPQDINSSEFLNKLYGLRSDLFVVIDYGKILNRILLNIPEKFCINLHASLLPKYRGAAPINWAIIKGESLTGVTIIKMNEFMDKGDIIAQEKIKILTEDTAKTLADRLSFLGAKLLIHTLNKIEKNQVDFSPQDETLATYAPKIKKKDGLINWKNKAEEIHNLVRGLIPYPGAFTYYKEKRLKIWKTKVVPMKKSSPSEILEVSSQGILVGTGKDSLLIQELQLEGKKKMLTKEFILGNKINIGERLGKNTCLKFKI